MEIIQKSPPKADQPRAEKFKMTIQNSKLGKIKIREILILAVLFLLPFYFIKFKYGWVSLNLVEILIIMLAAVWVWDKWGDWENKKDWKKYQWPAVLILFGVISSILANKNYHVGFGILKGWFVLPMVFAAVFYDGLKKNEKLLNWSLAALFYGGALVAVEGIYYWLSGLLTFDGRLRIFFDSPNQLAMYLAPVFLVGIVFMEHGTGNMEQSMFNRKIKLILASVGQFLITLNLYLTKSYGAWVALSLALAAVFWLKYREKLSEKIFAIIIIIFIILITLLSFGKFENIKNLGDRSSLASREMIWKSAGLMIQKNLVFGIGPGNFQSEYLGYQKYFPPYLEWAVPQPHNLFLAFWLEAGLLGLIGFVWLIGVFFADNKKAIGNNRLYGTLCLAIVLYFLIHGLVDTTYWRNDMAVFFWVVIAVNLYLAENKK